MLPGLIGLQNSRNQRNFMEMDTLIFFYKQLVYKHQYSDEDFGIIHFSAPQVHALFSFENVTNLIRWKLWYTYTQWRFSLKNALFKEKRHCVYSLRRFAPKDSRVVLPIYRIHFGTPFLIQKSKGVRKYSSMWCLIWFVFTENDRFIHEIELNFGTPFAFWNKKGVPKWILYIRRTTQESLGAQRRLLYMKAYCMKKVYQRGPYIYRIHFGTPGYQHVRTPEVYQRG